MQEKFILGNTLNNIYLSCRNNDAINDYIINLILQKINDELNDELGNSINFVKYDNLCVIKVNGKYKFCILMESMEDSLDNYLNKLTKSPATDKLVLELLQNIEADLNKLKTKEYLFTHTDMKVENIFF